MSADYVSVAGGKLNVQRPLYDLVKNEIAPGTGVEASVFWETLAAVVSKHGHRNKELLDHRKTLQGAIDRWYQARRDKPKDHSEFMNFLRDETDYFVREGPAFTVATENADPEVAKLSGPQLVVPGDDPRFAANAANARWLNAYDFFYGRKGDTNPIPERLGAEITEGYNPHRGAQVIAYAKRCLDEHLPLAEGSHANVIKYRLNDIGGRKELVAVLGDNMETILADSSKFVGYNLGSDGELSSILLQKHGLHIDIFIDRHDERVGRHDGAGVKKIMFESALTTIVDKEDAVSIVDAVDMVGYYRTWDQLMRGTLEALVQREGQKPFPRTLDKDRTYMSPEGKSFTLQGRSLLLARKVSKHMYTNAVTTADGEEIPEGFVDAAFTVYSALHDLKREEGTPGNSRTGHVYIVEPKFKGPEDVAAEVEVFRDIEEGFGLKKNTILIGLMDEEARMSANLREAIRAAHERVFFINTGYLDRGASQMRTHFYAGPMVTDREMRKHRYQNAYEDGNVWTGLETRLHEVGQIGKGMFVRADDMLGLQRDKIAHPKAGANTAWVASPKAAGWHVMHYHEIDVDAVQEELLQKGGKPDLEAIMSPPIMTAEEAGQITMDDVIQEVMEMTQALHGYVSRWVRLGIGCSKVPDFYDVALMEDRATLRKNSVRLANWIYWKVISPEVLNLALKTSAKIVDLQNASTEGYVPMSPLFNSPEFNAVEELIANAAKGPDGFTEDVLFKFRRQVKELVGN